MYWQLVLICLIFNICESARILGVIPSPSYSHQIVFRPIWDELSKRGHEVIVITTDPQRNQTSNVKEIDVSFAYGHWEPFIRTVEENRNPFFLMKYVKRFSLELCDMELSHPDVQHLLNNSTEKFDLIMAELFFPMMFGLAERFKCPLIGLASLDIPNGFYSMWGNPVHPIAYPDVFSTLQAGSMSFGDRVKSVLLELFFHIAHFQDFSWHILEKQFMDKHFGTGVPNMEAMMRNNISVVFVNVNPALSVRPVGPNIINIGGNLHIQPPKQLSKELQNFMDGAKHGVVYFSLGTNVKSSLISYEMRKIFLDTFQELPQRVLWKFDSRDLHEVPQNVKIVEWLPQQDILRHPKVKAFVFQGGSQSMEEAILNNVPLVGIPFISDQYSNVKKIVINGYGVQLDKTTLTKESLKRAIVEVIQNPRYKQNIIEIAELIKDQPMSGLQKAVWWTEYVLRHKGARHLRNPIVDMPLYKYYLLDVIGFLLTVLSICIYVVKKLSDVAKFIFLRKLSNKLKVS